MQRTARIKIALIASFICYLIGCGLYYFIWYKNGQWLHLGIVTLIVGGTSGVIWLFKENRHNIKKSKSREGLFVIVFVFLLVGFAGLISSLERKRVDFIFQVGPNTEVTAVVVDIDLRSTRSGKQPWSIIHYQTGSQSIEQSFPDTSKNLVVGKKYLIEYSIKYPDMFRVLKALK